jgi:hypothetical protein
VALGVKDLRKQNISLLVKWWWKLEKEDGLWQRLVKQRYLRNRDVCSVKLRNTDSPCWKNLLKVKEIYLNGRKVELKRGNLVRFWLDPWLDNIPLNESHPLLFNISLVPDVTFEHVVQSVFNIPFR